jgi:hypothetical protein
MVNLNRFYTYAYLREDRTPYYIGKGKGRRLYDKGKGEVGKPKDKSRIIYLKQNLTEEEAFRHEIYMIAVFGRIDLGTGILRNLTGGGDGSSGYIHNEEALKKISDAMKGKSAHNKGKSPSEETKRKLSEAHKGKTLSEEHKRKLSVMGKGKTFSEQTRRKLSEAKKGKKWWNDGLGNCKLVLECPGNGWMLGMK